MITDFSKPELVDGSVIVRVIAAGVNPVDASIRNGNMKLITGRKFPRILGYDFAGIVESSASPKYKNGDEVFGMKITFNSGTNAEFVAVKENELYYKPENLNFEEAASLPCVGLTAIQGFRKSDGIKRDAKLLVNGASGGVGSFAVQYAKYHNAEVHGVCSRKNIEFVNKLGADKAIDYTNEDIMAESGYDIIYDAIGNLSFSKSKRILAKKGKMVVAVPNFVNILTGYVFNFSGKLYRALMVKSIAEDLKEIHSLSVSGAIKPVVSRVYSIEQINDAHAQIETKRTVGKIVIKIQ